MEIRERGVRKEEVLKVMQLDPVLRDGHVVDCVPNLTARVKAIVKFISILPEQIRSFREAKVKLLNCWQEGDDLWEKQWGIFKDCLMIVYFFSHLGHRWKIRLRYKKTVKM